ncbi:hypothetical protein DFH06DRAFT_1183949 [Mycena polygramma]|nr:hypothetical protein DFH06DRAFT_1183949 [Mycena polygramma]
MSQNMPSIEYNTARSSSYGVQPKYYSNRAHRCRYPVIVDNIPPHICWQELKDFGRLAGGGHVAYCDLSWNKDGSGFIEYLFPEDAEAAIRKLNGQKLGGRVVSVSAYARAPRRRSRSRSPAPRRPHHEVPRDEPHRKCVFPISASRYSPRRPRERVASRDTFTSISSTSSAPPAVVDQAFYQSSPFELEPYQAGLFYQSSVSIDSNLPVQHQPGLAYDYYDFDAYLRLSYDRRLQGCHYS